MSKPPAYIQAFAKLLRTTEPAAPAIRLGELGLDVRRARIATLQYNRESFELLKGVHDYVVEIGGVEVELSIQLYLNLRDHYRLFVYSRAGSASGMLFSLNFTTAIDAAGIVAISQLLRFSEGRALDPVAASRIRQAKARILTDVLLRSGFAVTDNGEVELGTFSARRGEFLDTTPGQFVSGVLSVAVLKGHFQGNKGFQFACMPRLDDSFPWRWNTDDAVSSRLTPNRRGLAGHRAVPLGLRYRVLERDNGRCQACGRSRTDGVQLHMDHIVPYSLGGLTVFENLQSLCGECNLGKGNRSDRDFR